VALDMDEHAQVCAVIADVMAGSGRLTCLGRADEIIDALESDGWALVSAERLKRFEMIERAGTELAAQASAALERLGTVSPLWPPVGGDGA
jgi:hypothetical protein